VGPGRGLEGVKDHAGLHRCRRRLGVDRDNAMQVPGQVHHHARADRVARDRGACAPGRERHPEVEAGLDDADDLVGVAREHDDLGRHPVQRRVR
jgi:hypothetical protein